MITYHATKAGALPIIRVLLDGRWVGVIKEAPGGFRYVPKRGEGGAVYPTLRAVKASLEAEDEADACDAVPGQLPTPHAEHTVEASERN